MAVAMEANPFFGDIIKLEGETDRWRRRVGSYRLFFAVDRAVRTVSVNLRFQLNFALVRGIGWRRNWR